MHRGCLTSWHALPRLLRREGQHRCHQLHQPIQNLEHCRLSRTPSRIPPRIAVNPVFAGINIKRTQLNRTKPIQRMIDSREVVAFIRLPDCFPEFGQFSQNIAVQRLPFPHRILFRIKSRQIPQQDSQRIPNQPITVPHPTKDFGRKRDILPSILTRHPKPDHICPILLHQLHQGWRLPARFRHLFSIHIHHESIRQHCLKRSLPR